MGLVQEKTLDYQNSYILLNDGLNSLLNTIKNFVKAFSVLKVLLVFFFSIQYKVYNKLKTAFDFYFFFVFKLKLHVKKRLKTNLSII